MYYSLYTCQVSGVRRKGDEGECLVCLAWAPSQDLCTNTNTTQELDITTTFVSYLFVRIFNGMMLGKSYLLCVCLCCLVIFVFLFCFFKS